MFEIGNKVSINIVSGAFEGLYTGRVEIIETTNNRGVISYRYGVNMDLFPIFTPIYWYNEQELTLFGN